MKPFKSLSDAILDLEDILPYGKYKNCRVIDIVMMDHKYISYLQSKSGLFSKKVQRLAEEQKVKEEEKLHYENEIKPFLDDFDFEDVPY